MRSLFLSNYNVPICETCLGIYYISMIQQTWDPLGKEINNISGKFSSGVEFQLFIFAFLDSAEACFQKSIDVHRLSPKYLEK